MASHKCYSEMTSNEMTLLEYCCIYVHVYINTLHIYTCTCIYINIHIYVYGFNREVWARYLAILRVISHRNKVIILKK